MIINNLKSKYREGPAPPRFLPLWRINVILAEYLYTQLYIHLLLQWSAGCYGNVLPPPCRWLPLMHHPSLVPRLSHAPLSPSSPTSLWWFWESDLTIIDSEEQGRRRRRRRLRALVCSVAEEQVKLSDLICMTPIFDCLQHAKTKKERRREGRGWSRKINGEVAKVARRRRAVKFLVD